jgi:hypothetical protein
VIAILVIYGWYLGFQLNVVVGAAANDEDLPTLTLTEGIIEDIIRPFGRMAAVTFLVRLPALVYLLAKTIPQGLGAFDATLVSISFLFGNYDFLLKQDAQTVLVGGSALLFAYLLWPMLVLIVAIGGVGTIGRLDLILTTIVRTAPIYLIVTIIDLAAIAIRFGIAMLKFNVQVEGFLEGDLLRMFALPILLEGVGLLVMIIAMRALGLYYHYFKPRFAWSWG